MLLSIFDLTFDQILEFLYVSILFIHFFRYIKNQSVRFPILCHIEETLKLRFMEWKVSLKKIWKKKEKKRKPKKMVHPHYLCYNKILCSNESLNGEKLNLLCIIVQFYYYQDFISYRMYGIK